MILKDIQAEISVLGEARIPSPFLTEKKRSGASRFTSDVDRIILDPNIRAVRPAIEENRELLSFEPAGPRRLIYFDPSKVGCALVTCGGLCPGLNAIIRSVVLELYHGYGVRRIFGIRYGLQGFIPKYRHDVIDLSPDAVANIHEMGGSILGSSRGPQPVTEIVDSLERMNIGILFISGGDGTLKAATRITEEITSRGLKISVIGIPKTIDNDIPLVSRSFGFDTAVDIATLAIRAAHNEARGYPNGIGLIKLMGRHSGFIAATAALAQQDVNFVLIPEVDFDLDGPSGLLRALEKRLELRKHAVIVVAEGAGQHLFSDRRKDRDESGNIKLEDIGRYLKDVITSHFASKNIPISLKYIDPSYMIRSLPANSNDHVFCGSLGRNAVHAGMAGKTGMLVGHWNGAFVHIPFSASAGRRKHVEPDGELWMSVIDSTGQGTLSNG